MTRPSVPFSATTGHVTHFLQLKAESALRWIARHQGELARPLRYFVAGLQRFNLAVLARNPLNDPKHLGCSHRHAPLSIAVTCNELNVRNPTPLAPGQARFQVLPIEVCRTATKEGLRDVVECIDAHDRVKPMVNLARHDRRDAAARANMELRRGRTKRILGDQGRLTNGDSEGTRWAGSPYTTVLGAKGATARARGDLRGLRLPPKPEGDIAAVAATLNVHGRPVHRRPPRRSALPPQASQGCQGVGQRSSLQRESQVSGKKKASD